MYDSNSSQSVKLFSQFLSKVIQMYVFSYPQRADRRLLADWRGTQTTECEKGRPEAPEIFHARRVNVIYVYVAIITEITAFAQRRSCSAVGWA